MGTRNLTIVKSKGKVKLAQYGQWDGYPMGQGKVIANFIQNEMNLKEFKKYIDALSWASKKEVKEAWEDCGANPSSDFVDFDTAETFSAIYPQFSRDTGAEILGLIQTGFYPKVVNSLNFLKDSLFCEYAYELNLDNKTVTVYAWGKTKVKTYLFSEFTVDEMEALQQKMGE